MKYKICSLGCKVNEYEKNGMDHLLKEAGYLPTSDIADIYVINTCTVTNTANNKSLKMIRHCRREAKNAILLVCGCASQIYTDQVKKEDVNIIIGNVGKSKIIDYIKKYQKEKKQIIEVEDITKNTPFEPMKVIDFNKTRAFVKIQDGCNNFCSYCIIPYSRGNLRSRDIVDIIKEIKTLIKENHHEIVLTGIHTGHYQYQNYDLADLITEIVKIPGLQRLRISSIEITELNDKMLDCLRKYPTLVDHLHIPLQSGSNEILKQMNRKYDKEYFIEKVKTIRTIRPDISITTDVIVGFPGEADELFQETIDTILKISFSGLHVFPYSKRDNTKAALMKDQIKEEIKKERVHQLLKLSTTLEINYMNKFIGREVDIIPEVTLDNYTIGHTGNYLSVKTKKRVTKTTIKDIEYPNCIGTD